VHGDRQYAIREAKLEDAGGIARVHVDTWRHAYRGLLHDEVLQGLSLVDRTRSWSENLSQPPALYVRFVAEVDQEIVAFASGGPNRSDGVYTGELYALYVLPTCQRRGLGRQLTGLTAQALRERGFTSMSVWVLRDNPACLFYERLGGRYIGEKDITIAGTAVPEISYGWMDTLDLAKQAEANL